MNETIIEGGMTVAQLIEALQKYPKHLKVVVDNTEWPGMSNYPLEVICEENEYELMLRPEWI